MMRMKVESLLVLGIVACSSDTTVPTLGACTAASSQTVSLAVGQYASIDPSSNAGCISFPANASATDSAIYLIAAQSVANAPNDSAPFFLMSANKRPAATQVIRSSLVAPPVQRSIAKEFDATLRRAERTGFAGMGRPRGMPRGMALSAVAPPPSRATLPALSSFRVCDTVTCFTTQTVIARKMSVGAHVAIYVDTLAPKPPAGLNQADLDSLAQEIDVRLYPLDVANFGAPTDIDSNNVVIVLMTNIVNQLVTKDFCNSVGFVLGFFFGGDLYRQTSFLFNRGEIYYSLVADPDSTLSCAHPTLQVKRLSGRTFSHELQHMINFGQHAVLRAGISEEGWLDEGLSTYAEELAGRSYAPGDTANYRRFLLFGDLFNSYEYLRDPGSSYLMIPQDIGTIPEIGASWMFTRYLMDQFGAGLAAKLVQTTAYGSANITAQTGVDYKLILSRWALANYVSDLPGFTAPPELKYTSWQFRTAYDTLRTKVLAFGDSIDFYNGKSYPLVPPLVSGDSLLLADMLRSGSAHYMLIGQAPKGAGFILSFTSDKYQAIAPVAVPRLNVIRLR